MYVIEKEEELIGKEVAFAWTGWLSEYTIIGTKCHGVYIASYEIDFEADEGEIRAVILRDYQVIRFLESKDYIRKLMIEAKVLDDGYVEEYKKKRIEEENKRLEIAEQNKKVRERKEYERLKAIYGNEK